MKRKIDEVILYVKKYIIKKYNYFSINISDNFIGVKFHKDRYYIFYIIDSNGDIMLNYREDFTKPEKIVVNISLYSNPGINFIIDKIITFAEKTNTSLTESREKLSNSLVFCKGEKKLSKSIVRDKKNNFTKEEITKKKNSINRIVKNIDNRKKRIITDKNEVVDTISDSKIIEMNSIDNNSNIVFNPDCFKVFSIITLDDYEMSVRLKNILLENGILNIYDLMLVKKEKLKEFNNLGKKSFEEACEIKNKIRVMCNYDKQDDNCEFLYLLLKKLAYEKSISLIGFKNFLINNSNYPTSNLINDINILRKKDKLEYTMDGLKIKYFKLTEYIDTMEENSKKQIFLKRLNGKTLEEIGKEFGVTRERIRQIISKYINNMPVLFEDKYSHFYEKYNFSEEDFCKIFDVHSNVYYYFREKYKAGISPIKDAITDVDFNNYQKEKLYDILDLTFFNGEFVKVNKHNIISSLAKEKAQDITKIDDFTLLYNKFCENNESYNLEKVDTRSMEGMLSRSGIALFGLGRQFRYYDYSSVSSKEIRDFIKVFELETGYYSTEVLIKNYDYLMKKLDIRDEYELHNFAKNFSYKLKNITFDRMPHFSVNGIEKKEFFLKKIIEMSPILLYDFVSIMVDEYGHKKSSLNSYLLTEFKDYIVNNVINYNVDVLLDKDIERLKMILIDDIYDLDTLKELLLKNGYKASVVNTINMTKVGFKIRSSYILKNCFSSVEEYVDKLVLNNSFISNYNFLKNSTYSPTMKKIEKKLDIFLISKDEYITISKLNELGITKSDIEFFISLVLNNFRGIKCFNLYNVFQTIPINRLYDFGFDDIFFENIIQNISGIYEIKVFNNNFFSFCDSELDVFNFILNCFDGEKAVTTDQLLHNLYEFYGISLSLDELKSLVEKTDFYYSEIFSKIYIDKDLYYKEVYNYE